MAGKGAHLSACNRELLLALLAMSGLIIFKPGVALTGGMIIQDKATHHMK